MKQCKVCGSYAFNLYKEDIDQGDLCDVHYWKEKALAQPELIQQPASVDEMHSIGNGIMYGAQPEPVAYVWKNSKGWLTYVEQPHDRFVNKPLYTTPPQRTWVGLTDEEINQSYADSYKGIPLHEGIEAKLKEKNT